MYSREVLGDLGVQDRVGIVKLGTTWPLPEKFLQEHLKKAEQILFVEDVDPFLENNVKALCAQNEADLGNKTFMGKASGTIPTTGETTPDIVNGAIRKLLAVPYESRPAHYAQEAAELFAYNYLFETYQLVHYQDNTKGKTDHDG